KAEEGIRGWSVTGVQTCALPIYWARMSRGEDWSTPRGGMGKRGSFEEDDELYLAAAPPAKPSPAKPRTIRSGPYERNHEDIRLRSEERRVGKECRTRGWACEWNK